MATNKEFDWVDGASKKEVDILKTLNATEIINACSVKEPKVTRYLYYKFVAGKQARHFVRVKIMQFVRDKSKKLEKAVKESKER
jgi:hypothetical protein